MAVASPSALVVGAGPVGLTAAIELTRLGARVRIVDQREARTVESRAVAVNPRSLELLEPSGVTEQLLKVGVHMRGVRIFTRGRPVATVDATRIKHRFRFILALAQNETERVMEERLNELGITVERGTRLADLTLGEPPEAVLEKAGQEEQSSFDWIVGADGAHSVVRKEIGATFSGERYPFEWSLADVMISGPVEADRGEIHLDPGKPLLFRVPIGGGRQRLISNGPGVLGRFPPSWRVGEVFWESDFSVSHRQADRIVSGRVVIIGDAAHIHSPAGGRGMNLGIEDAATLAPRIMAGDLGDWAEGRRARAAEVIRESDRMQSFATADGFFPRTLVPLLAAIATRIPPLQDIIVAQLSGFGRSRN